MRHSFPLPLFALVLVVSFANPGWADDAPDGLRLTVERISPAPLPYQSCRLRIVLANTRDEKIAAVRAPEVATWLLEFKPPESQIFRKPGGENPYSFRPSFIGALGVPPPRYVTMAAAARLTLQPGKSVAISAAFGPHRHTDGVFFEPGVYQLKFGHINRLPGGYELFTDKPVEVRVGQPAGPDAPVYEMIRKKPFLADTLALARQRNFRASRNNLADLCEIIAKHPKSSYADYARYLIALDLADPKYDEQGQIVAWHKDLPEAIKLMDGINFKDFAFGAETLVWLKSVVKDAAKLKEYDQRLRTDFYDSYEWLEELGKTLTYDQLLEARQPPKDGK